MNNNDFYFVENSPHFKELSDQINEFFQIGNVPDAQAGKLRKIAELIVKKVLELEGRSNWYEGTTDRYGNLIKNPTFSQNINYLRDQDIFPHAITGKLNDIRHGGNYGMHDDSTIGLSEATITELISKLHDVLVYFVNSYDGTHYDYNDSRLNSLAYHRPYLFKKRSVISNNSSTNTTNTYHPSSNYSNTTTQSSSSSNYDYYSNSSSYQSSNYDDYTASEQQSHEDPQAATKRSHRRILGAIVAILAIIFVIHSCSSGTKSSSSNNYNSSDSYNDNSDDSSKSSNQFKGNWLKGKVFQISVSTSKIEVTKDGSTSDYDDVLPKLNYSKEYLAFDPNGKRFIVTDYADEAFNIVKNEENFDYALKNYHDDDNTYVLKNKKLTLTQPHNGWYGSYAYYTTYDDAVTFSSASKKKVNNWFKHLLYHAEFKVKDDDNIYDNPTDFEYTSTLRFSPKDFEYTKGDYEAKYTLDIKFNMVKDADDETTIAADHQKLNDDSENKNWLAGRIYKYYVKATGITEPNYDYKEVYENVKLPYLKYDDYYVVFDPNGNKHKALGTQSLLDASDASSSEAKFDALYNKQGENWTYNLQHNYLDLHTTNLKLDYDSRVPDSLNFSSKGIQDVQSMMKAGVIGLYLTKDRANSTRDTYEVLHDQDFTGKDISDYTPEFTIETTFNYVDPDNDN